MIINSLENGVFPFTEKFQFEDEDKDEDGPINFSKLDDSIYKKRELSE